MTCMSHVEDAEDCVLYSDPNVTLSRDWPWLCARHAFQLAVSDVFLVSIATILLETACLTRWDGIRTAADVFELPWTKPT